VLKHAKKDYAVSLKRLTQPCKMTTIKDIQRIQNLMKSSQVIFPLAKAILGITPPRCRQQKMTKLNQRFISLGRSDFGDDSPKVPASWDLYP
jgi:hypothetical protein